MPHAAYQDYGEVRQRPITLRESWDWWKTLGKSKFQYAGNLGNKANGGTSRNSSWPIASYSVKRSVLKSRSGIAPSATSLDRSWPRHVARSRSRDAGDRE